MFARVYGVTMKMYPLPSMNLDILHLVGQMVILTFTHVDPVAVLSVQLVAQFARDLKIVLLQLTAVLVCAHLLTLDWARKALLTYTMD